MPSRLSPAIRRLYPISAYNAEALYNDAGTLFLRFSLTNGEISCFAYSDIIHLRRDYCSNDIFGTSPMDALAPLLKIMGTLDNSVVKAVKNSGSIRWLLKYNTSMRDEDLERNANKFAENYLSTSASGSGVAAVDSKADATQVKTDDYVPNAALIDRAASRFYSYFGVNPEIIQSRYNEDQWNAFYESTVVRNRGREQGAGAD